jgi:two-component sensor histidine kinase
MRREAPRTWSLLALLLAYGALATLPIIMVGSYLFFTALQSERDHLQERVRQVAAAVAGDVDRELQRRETVLGTLATSPLIASGDFAGFHAQARAAVANQNLVVLLHDAISKQQLVNTFVDYGTSLPTTGDPGTFDRVLSTKRVEVSDLFMSLVSKEPAIDIALPITKDGNVRYLLKLALTPDHFWQIIAEHSLELRWRVTIVDRRGIIIARTDAQDRFVGQALPGAELKEMRGADQMFASTSIDGAMTAWATVPSAGWTVRASAPFDVTQSSFYRSIGLTSAVASALVLTLLLGLFFAARLNAPLSSVARMAQGLVRQAPIIAPPPSYKEADMLAAALKEAAEELAQLRERERLVVQESGHRIKNILSVVQSLVRQTLRDERAGEMRTRLLQRLEALARAQAALTSSDWTGISLEQLVAAELEPYASQVTLDGPRVVLSGSAAQTFSLLIHELGTNAAKYGALSNAEGRISIVWSIDDREEGSTLRFRWQESGGPPVKQATSRGFGTTLLEASLLGGRSLINYEPDGVVYVFEAPLRGLTPNSNVRTA